MRSRKSLSALVMSVALVANAASASESKKLEGWGNAIDPAGDCKFDVKEGKLRITVPGSVKPHDLSPELNSSTAPRALQAVKGDFVIQVKVGGEFEPGDKSAQEGRTGYTGAGLVVSADDKNFVRIERATLKFGEGESVPYTNFEIRVDGKVERMGTTGDLPTVKDKPTWLRLERHGDELRGAMSQDGENWKYGEAKKLKDKAWGGDKLLAGVAAISTSSKDFAPVYSDLSVKQGPTGGAKVQQPADGDRQSK